MWSLSSKSLVAMSESNFCDVLIIGAGPSGLAVGRALSLLGIAVQLLERDQAGSTWHHVPDDLRVLSPWWTNVLDLRDVLRCNPFTRVAAWEFRRYLLDFAAKAALAVHEGKEVCMLKRHDGEWCAFTHDGSVWRAKHVICATGYFSTPWIPGVPFVSDETIPSLHASRIENYDEFFRQLSGRRILLVGKRVTAGQLMVEMCRRDLNVMLSATSPVEFRRSGSIGELLDQIYFFYEAARILLQPSLHANSYPVMDGGETERLIASGRVQIVPRPVAIANKQVIFEDGGCASPDLVIFATGYRPTLGYLEGVCNVDPTTGLPATCNFELIDAPGIFVLGFDNLRNFRSRYLRGIRSDAKVLANIIANRLVS
jgi:hypothetical protein